MENPFSFDFDENTEVPSKKEIYKTLRGNSPAPRKTISTKPKKTHPIIKVFMIFFVAVILVGGGFFGYFKLTEDYSSPTTGGVTGISSFSSAITGFFVQEPLPEEEKFGVKISGREINLLSEEQKLKSNLTNQCAQEKLQMKASTEDAMEYICDTEKTNLQNKIDSWKSKYENCKEDSE
jgi:hypothetical protein